MTALLVFPMELYVLSRCIEASRKYGGDLWIYLSPKPPLGAVLVKYQKEAYQETICFPEGDAGLDEFVEVARDRIDAVVPCGEFSVGLANDLAERLGVVNDATFDRDVFRDKASMRRAFAAHDVPQPRVLATFDSLEDCDAFDWDKVEFPVVVKPIDLSASLYVRICDSAAQVRQMVRRILLHRSSFGGMAFQARALLEEVAAGPEYSLEVIVSNGKVVKTFLTTKFLSPLPSRYEVGHMAGETLTRELMSDLDKVAQKVVDAGRLENGVAHVEVKIENGKINVIEAAGRVGGDMISEITQLQHGVSLEEALLLTRSGKRIGRDWVSDLIPEPDKWFHGIKYIYRCDGSSPVPNGIEIIRQTVTTFPEKPGTADFSVLNRVGHVLARSRSAQSLREFIARGDPE